MSPADVGVPRDLAAESGFQTFTRVGFVARGILYVTVAMLLIRTGQTEDLSGALGRVREGAGSWLLAIMAAGMAAYGLWRIADAALGIEHQGHERKDYAKRAAAGVAGAIYLFLAYKAVRLLTSAPVQEQGGGQQASTVLGLPGGAVILGLAAIVMLVAGASQLVTASKCDFLKRLDPRAKAPLVKWLGRLGYAARGVIFIAMAYLIARAAIEHDASRAGGMEQAMDSLSGSAQFAVAAGLALFGLFSFVEARFRRIHAPPADSVARMARKVPG